MLVFFAVSSVEFAFWNFLKIPTSWVVPMLIFNIIVTFFMGLNIDPRDKWGKIIATFEVSTYLFMMIIHWTRFELLRTWVIPVWLRIALLVIVIVANIGQVIAVGASYIPIKGKKEAS